MALNKSLGIRMLPEQKQQIIHHLKAAIIIINDLKIDQVTEEEDKKVRKISNMRLAYVRKVFENFADMFPILRPSFMNYEKAKNDYQLASDIQEIRLLNDEFLSFIGNASKITEDSSYGYLLEFYDCAKRDRKKNLEGASLVYDELSQLFRGQGTNNSDFPDSETKE